MAAVPVYLLSLTGRICVVYLAYKAVEKLTREFLWYPSSAAHAVTVDIGAAVGPHRVPVIDRYPSPSVAPAVTVDTVATVVHVSFTEDAPVSVSSSEDGHVGVSSTEDEPVSVSSTEDAPVNVETLEEEFRTVGLEDNNKDDDDEDEGFKKDNIEGDSLVRDAKHRKNLYPQRPDAADCSDCSNYFSSETCRYGANCKYNHPATKENQVQKSASPESAQVIREKEKEDLAEKMEQQECKSYIESEGCKFGKAHRHKWSQKKSVVPPPPQDFNFLDLPIRPGERECQDYMRNGSCKDGPNCWFHHPDPTTVGEGDVPSVSVSLHLSGASQPTSTSWSSPPNETVPYLDAANPYVPMVLPSQEVHPNPEWDGYQTERECLHSVSGSCKYGHNYRFHHLDPIAVGGGDIPYGSVPLYPSGASQLASTSWSSPPNETVPYLDAADPYVLMMVPPQGVHPNPYDPIAVGGGDIPSGSVSLHPSGASQLASTSWSSPPNETVPYVDAANPYVPLMLPPQWMHSNPEWNVYQASLSPNGTQPLLAANPNPLGWNKPKTNTDVNGTLRKKTKIVQSAWCEICKIDCKSKDVLDNHKLGKKHKKNLEKLEESKTKASTPGATAAAAAKDPMVGPKESPVADKGKTVVVQQGKEKGVPSLGPGEDLETQRRKLIEGGAATDAVRVCMICNMVCNSQTVFNNHLAGRKHAKMVKKQEATVGTENPSGTSFLSS